MLLCAKLAWLICVCLHVVESYHDGAEKRYTTYIGVGNAVIMPTLPFFREPWSTRDSFEQALQKLPPVLFAEKPLCYRYRWICDMYINTMYIYMCVYRMYICASATRCLRKVIRYTCTNKRLLTLMHKQTGARMHAYLLTRGLRRLMP